MALRGFKRNFKPFEILTEDKIDAIHRGTLEVLWQTGIRIEHERALKLLEKNGCKVDYGNMRVKFPVGLVEECLRKVPSCFPVKARDPKNDLFVGGDTLYFTTFPGMQKMDLDTWERRPPTRKEYYDAVTVLDALDNLHYTCNYTPWFGFEGVPPVMSIPEGFAAVLRNSTKVLKTGYSQDCEMFTMRMGEAVGIDVLVSAMASPPLTYYTDSIESLYRGIEAGYPVFLLSGGVMGGTAPATIAGSTLTNNAELIAAVVLSQLISPGAKILVEDFVFPQNMQSGIPVFGAIECALHCSVFIQYFRRFGIPVMTVLTGPSSSKRIDFQCGYEKASIALIAALSGAHCICLHGCVFGELIWHPLQAVLDDDIAGMIGRFLQGVEVNEETLAIDLIDEVGPIPGFYLDKKHTREWWKREQFLPKATDRLPLSEWMEKGKKSALDYAQERIEEILATHKPNPLTSKQEEDVERILEEARQYYTKKGLM